MKRITSLFFFCIISSVFNLNVVGQCASKKFIDSCTVFPKEYIFSKARTINIQSKKDLSNAIYAVILTKGNTYIITVCEDNNTDNEGPMVVNLLDNKDRLLMSNHNAKTDKYYNKIIFNCNASGTYHLSYLFNGGSSKGCGVSAFGFQKR